MSFLSKVAHKITNQVARDLGNVTKAATGSSEAGHAVTDLFERGANEVHREVGQLNHLRQKVDKEALRGAKRTGRQAVRDARNGLELGRKGGAQAIRDAKNGAKLGQRAAEVGADLGQKGARQAVRDARFGAHLAEKTTEAGAEVGTKSVAQMMRDAQLANRARKAVDDEAVKGDQAGRDLARRIAEQHPDRVYITDPNPPPNSQELLRFAVETGLTDGDKP